MKKIKKKRLRKCSLRIKSADSASTALKIRSDYGQESRAFFFYALQPCLRPFHRMVRTINIALPVRKPAIRKIEWRPAERHGDNLVHIRRERMRVLKRLVNRLAAQMTAVVSRKNPSAHLVAPSRVNPARILFSAHNLQRPRPGRNSRAFACRPCLECSRSCTCKDRKGYTGRRVI